MNPFGIAPLLDRGWRLDPYERFLIARIKTGRYCSDLWDCNSFYLGYSERLAGLRAPRIAVKSRYEMTAEQRRAWNNSYGDPALNAERARKKAAEAERNAERARVEAEWAEKRAKRAAEEEARRAEWAARGKEIEAELEAKLAAMRAIPVPAEIVGFPLTLPDAERRRAERARIMAAPWQCVKCLKRATIEAHLGGFKIACGPCGESAFGEHERLVKVVEAQAA